MQSLSVIRIMGFVLAICLGIVLVVMIRHKAECQDGMCPMQSPIQQTPDYMPPCDPSDPSCFPGG